LVEELIGFYSIKCKVNHYGIFSLIIMLVFAAHGTAATARKQTNNSLDEGKKQTKAGKSVRKQAQAPGDLVEADQHPMKRQRRRLGWKDHPHLAERRPDLVAEWDEAKNGCSANEVSCGNLRKTWWCCQDCGKYWQTITYDRVKQQPGCLGCRKKKKTSERCQADGDIALGVC
jgi:hypothetical protein